MSKKLFTEQEIIILKQNKYVKKVTSKGITYTDEFKRIFIDENGTWFKVEKTEENKLKMENNKQIENVFKYLKQMDVL